MNDRYLYNHNFMEEIQFLLIFITIFLLFSCDKQFERRTSGDLISLDNKPEFSLEIIPHNYPIKKSDNSSISLWFPEFQHFYVVLTNKSEQPIKIWEQWNSWGFFCLSFEITYPDGRKVRSKKFNSSGWDKNFPSWIQIPPEKHYIFEVNFENDQTMGQYWLNSVLNNSGDSTFCKLKAIYEISRDKDSVKEGVWTGRVESLEKNYVIWH